MILPWYLQFHHVPMDLHLYPPPKKRFPKMWVPLVIIHVRLGFPLPVYINYPAIGVPPIVITEKNAGNFRLRFFSEVSLEVRVDNQGHVPGAEVRKESKRQKG